MAANRLKVPGDQGARRWTSPTPVNERSRSAESVVASASTAFAPAEPDAEAAAPVLTISKLAFTVPHHGLRRENDSA